MNQKLRSGLEMLIGTGLCLAAPALGDLAVDYVATEAGPAYDQLSEACMGLVYYGTAVGVGLPGVAIGITGALRGYASIKKGKRSWLDLD